MLEAREHSGHLAASYTWDAPVAAHTVRWDYSWQEDASPTIFNYPWRAIDSWDQHDAAINGERHWVMVRGIH